MRSNALDAGLAAAAAKTPASVIPLIRTVPSPSECAGGVTILPLALETIEDEKLGNALRCWRELCGPREVYPRDDLGFRPLVGAPEILNGRSSVVASHSDDPMNYTFVYYGDGFNVYEDRSFVARRLAELPDQDVVQGLAKCFHEAVQARRPLAHRISAHFDGVEVTYDRVIFPTVNKSGAVDRLVTLSTEVSRD